MTSRHRKALGLPPTMDLKTAAAELSIKPSTLTALIEAGLVWTILLAGEQLVPLSEIRRLAEIHEVLGRRR